MTPPWPTVLADMRVPEGVFPHHADFSSAGNHFISKSAVISLQDSDNILVFFTLPIGTIKLAKLIKKAHINMTAGISDIVIAAWATDSNC